MVAHTIVPMTITYHHITLPTPVITIPMVGPIMSAPPSSMGLMTAPIPTV